MENVKRISKKACIQAAACLSHILESYDHSKLKQDAVQNISRASSVFPILGRMARVRGLKVELREIKDPKEVAARNQMTLLRLAGDHYVVLRRISRNRCYLYDPCLGFFVLKTTQLTALMEGEAMVVKAPMKIQREEETTSSVRRLLDSFRRLATA